MHRPLNVQQLGLRNFRFTSSTSGTYPKRIVTPCSRKHCLRRQPFSSSRPTFAALAHSPKPVEKYKSPIETEQELSLWEDKYSPRTGILIASAGRAASKTGAPFEADTNRLTDLCQKQVNYWHNRNPLGIDQVNAVKKIAKLSILNRHNSLLSVVSTLKNGSSIQIRS